MTAEQVGPELGEVRNIVDRAVTAAVPRDQMVERKLRPDSAYGWPEPRPAAGLHAALTVARIAEDRAYKFAKALRSEGSSWSDLADLLQIPWSDQYARRERAYELVAGPADNRRDTLSDLRVYWTCNGPDGCGEHICDRGPYNGYPVDNEDGHADDCRRLAAETAAYERECTERERRAEVMDEAIARLGNSFAADTAHRARRVIANGGRYMAWSTSETLAVALVLGDDDELKKHGYSSREAAADRVFQGMRFPPREPAEWWATVRAAATGLTGESKSS